MQSASLPFDGSRALSGFKILRAICAIQEDINE